MAKASGVSCWPGCSVGLWAVPGAGSGAREPGSRGPAVACEDMGLCCWAGGKGGWHCRLWGSTHGGSVRAARPRNAYGSSHLMTAWFINSAVTGQSRLLNTNSRSTDWVNCLLACSWQWRTHLVWTDKGSTDSKPTFLPRCAANTSAAASLSLPPLPTNAIDEKHKLAGLKKTQGMHYSPLEHHSLPRARPADQLSWEVRGSDVSRAAFLSGFSKWKREVLLQNCWRHSHVQSQWAMKAIFQWEISLCYSPVKGIYHSPDSSGKNKKWADSGSACELGFLSAGSSLIPES